MGGFTPDAGKADTKQSTEYGVRSTSQPAARTLTASRRLEEAFGPEGAPAPGLVL
jgi:hypothetical protein